MRTLLFLVVAASAALAAVPASATPPTPVSGTFAIVAATTTNTRAADGNTFTTLTRTATLSGSFTGTTTDTVMLVMHSNGTTILHGSGTCACTVEGRSGTLVYTFNGKGTFPTSATGRYVVGHGTGALAGLHAQGPFSGNFSVATIGGRYHFE